MTYGDASTGTRERLPAVDDSASMDETGLDHAAARAQLLDYLDDALEPEQRERVRHHLDRCRGCRAFLRSLEQTIALAGQLPTPRLPDRRKRLIMDRLATAAEAGASRG